MPNAEQTRSTAHEAKDPAITALGAGLETALIGFVISLAALVFVYALNLSDTVLQQCLPISLLVFGGLGALAGVWTFQRGAHQRSRVLIAGAIAGVVSGMGAGALRGVFYAFLDLSPDNFFILGASDAGVLRVGLLQAFILTMPTVGIQGLIAGTLGALAAKQFYLRSEPADAPARDHPSPHPTVQPEAGKADDPAAELPPLEQLPSPLRPALRALRSGERTQAKSHIARYLKAHLDSEPAWLLMAAALDDHNQKRECLQRALKINPHNRYAQRMLAQLDAPAIAAETAIPLASAKPKRQPEDEGIPSATPQEVRKGNLVILTVGLAIAAIVPIAVMLIDRYALDIETLTPTVILLAGGLGLATGLNMAREDLGRERLVLYGALNGLVVALFTTFAFSAAYHTIFLPWRSDHTRLQGVFYLIMRWGVGMVFWGAAIGGVTAFGAPYLRRARVWVRETITAAAPHSAWASLWLAYTSDDPDRKRRLVDRALSMSPSNPLALRMKRSLEKPPGVAAREAAEPAQKLARSRFQLPPLATSAMGRKFLRRVVAFIIMASACSLVGNIMGIEGDYFEVLTSFVVMILILFGGGFVLWFIVQLLRR